MRLIRVPYIYLPTAQVTKLIIDSILFLGIISDVHNGISNSGWCRPEIKNYMYHSSFLRWVFLKASAELAKRGRPIRRKLDNRLLCLQSRKLSEFVPPTDAEIAEDVVWLLEQWKYRYLPGGRHLPFSYIELAQSFYDYSPQQAAYERIEQISGHSRDADREWYNCQGEEEAQVAGNPVGKNIRFCGDEGW